MLPKNHYLKGWDSLYKKGRQGKYPNEMLVRFINKNFPLIGRSEIRVLDLGFGTGRHLVFLAEEGFSTYGLEYSKDAFEIAKCILNERHLDADLKLGLATDKSVYGQNFDGIVDVACIQHNLYSDIEKIIDNVYDSLKVGGHFFSLIKNSSDSLFNQGVALDNKTKSYPGGIEKISDSTLICFPSYNDLQLLFAAFSNVAIDKEEWTYSNMTQTVSHWVVTATK